MYLYCRIQADLGPVGLGVLECINMTLVCRVATHMLGFPIIITNHKAKDKLKELLCMGPARHSLCSKHEINERYEISCCYGPLCAVDYKHIYNIFVVFPAHLSPEHGSYVICYLYFFVFLNFVDLCMCGVD